MVDANQDLGEFLLSWGNVPTNCGFSSVSTYYFYGNHNYYSWVAILNLVTVLRADLIKSKKCTI